MSFAIDFMLSFGPQYAISMLIAELLARTLYCWLKKPRTYQQKARKQYLGVVKQKKPGAKKIRKAIGQQLNYVRRNLGHIAQIVEAHPGMLGRLRRYDYKCLLVIHTLYDQQRQMHSQRVHTTAKLATMESAVSECMRRILSRHHSDRSADAGQEAPLRNRPAPGFPAVKSRIRRFILVDCA